MILVRIKLKDFQIYRNYETDFSLNTFIRGRNGAGKTTLGLEALLFCLWGYSSKNLTDIPTRGQVKTCSVTVELKDNSDFYAIERRIPTFLQITKNGVILNFETNTEAQGYLNNAFGDVMTFKQFRIIDNEIGINLLDPRSAMTFKKIVFSLIEEQFNRAKENLSKLKQEREIWNRDSAVVFTHHPSDARISRLRVGLQASQNQQRDLQVEDHQLGNEEYQQSNVLGQLQGHIRNLESQRARMSKTSCYACGQPINLNKNTEMIAHIDNEINGLRQKVCEATEVLNEIRELRQQGQRSLTKIGLHIQKLNRLIMRLEGRLKQREFIYTSHDVEVVKSAIKELESISTGFLIKSIRSLEPIINEVLAKIEYSLEFDMNDKGKFDIRLLHKDGQVFSYKDLSTGQRLMLQIAFKLALLLERGESGIIIADEGLSSLDKENLLHVLRIFENYPFQLICILHHFDEIPAGAKIIDLEESANEKNQSTTQKAMDLDSGKGNKVKSRRKMVARHESK